MDFAFPAAENAFVRLIPLNLQEHAEALRAICTEDPEALAFWPYFGPGDWVGNWLRDIETRKAAGSLFPYAVMSQDSGKFLGVTAYLAPDTHSRNVEVGMTLYSSAVRGTAINPATKLIMLGQAFAAGALRVQINVDVRNTRSRAAVLKLGARLEGVLRSNRLLPTGYVRDTAVYSMLASEWPEVESSLKQRLEAYRLAE